jgi:hypothetical protein
MLSIVAAACSGRDATLSVPERPALDGGLGFGSGHVVSPDTQSVAASNQAATVDDSTSAGRNGLGFGSGH